MAQSSNGALWFGSHCGSPRWAKWIYKIVNGALYQRANEPYASKWLKIESATIEYVNDHCVTVKYAHEDSERCFGLWRV